MRILNCKYSGCILPIAFGSGYCWGHYAGVCAGLPAESRRHE